NLPDAAREGRGQPPRRINVAKQHVRHAIAALYAGIPRLQNCRRLFLQTRHGERTAVDENHEHRFAGGDNGVKQFHLPAGKAKVAARRIFAGPAGRFASTRITTSAALAADTASAKSSPPAAVASATAVPSSCFVILAVSV